MTWIKELPKEECILPGTTSCIGCGAALSLRLALRILGKRTILIIPANCTAIIQGSYPRTTFTIPVLNVAFASSAAVASGVLAALRVRGISNVNVVVWAGDGATADIGLSGLSSAAHRQENMLYICYDNEGYMNTGVQESGATPFGALTANSPGGKRFFKKNMPLIMNDHNIPYIATANISYAQDFIMKVRKALTYSGFKYIHLFSPCPPGWRIPANETVHIGRLAVETGAWPLFEIENGQFQLNAPSVNLLNKEKRKPIEEYLRIQERYKQVTDEEIKIIERWIDYEWAKYSELQKPGISQLQGQQ
jgi:pyruvate ferredoxin oxidoreductase beta subunit